MPYRSSKTLNNFPCSHRRHVHKGHCAFVHGYSRSFTFWFEADELAPGTGFVMDFGQMKEVKAWLDYRFDHTLLLDEDDPLLGKFRDLEKLGACRIITFDSVGMEGTAKYVFDNVRRMIRIQTHGRVRLVSVECRENNKNSAIYASE
jgi:6-pyruvoyltetrahydropterin/6-carboxytetrahydropterin synthase